MLKVVHQATLSALMLGIIFPTPSISAEDYPIVPGDTLEISVFARPDLSRIYRVRADGMISLHMIGKVKAEGRSPSELEYDIETLLTQQFSDMESVTLEVASYMPVIVSGDIATPGQVPFHAGIDVRWAVAMGGGMFRPVDVDDTGNRMRVSGELANADLLAARLAALEVTRARLIAARDGKTTLNMAETAPEQHNNVQDHSLIAAATALLEALDQAQNMRAEVQDDQVRLAREEAEAFAERRTLLTSQLETVLSALEDQESLRERGLARADRVVELTLDVSSLRVDILESIGLEAAARQKLESAQSAPMTEDTELQLELAELLVETESAILETTTQLDRSRSFVREYGGIETGGEFEMAATYSIHRRSGGAARVIEAVPDTLLHPGDNLEVRRISAGAGLP